MNKYICPNSFGRDDFYLPKSLFLTEQLECLVSERPSFLYKDRLKDCKEIVDKYNVSVYALFLDAYRRLKMKMGDSSAQLIDWIYVSQMVGEKANKIAKQKNLKIFSELYSAYAAFSGVQKENCVLFQTHPHASHLRKLYQILQNSENAGVSEFNEYRFEYELEMWSDKIFTLLDKPVSLASKIICTTEYVKNSILENYPEIVSSIKVIPYGVNSFHYPIKTKKIKKGKTKFLYVGQKTARKGFVNLMSAWSRGIKNSELHIVGFDVPENDKIELQKLGVIVHGRVNHEQLIATFHDCDCFIFPSISEGFGLVLLQSISCGTPIIGSINSAAPDLIDAHDVGMTINPFSVEEIYQSMILAAENQDILLKWAGNCLQARAYYGWSRFQEEVSTYLM